jgi:peptidyl-tRNA hydrolase
MDIFGGRIMEKEFIDNPVEAYEKLKAENDRLKNALAIWENATQKQTALKVIEVDKYRQTLQEIKKICKNSHTSASEDYYRTADKILQEINEVIGAEE